MLPATPQYDPVWALVVGIIYFGSFIAIGFAGKRAIGWLMRRRGADLDDVHAQAAGPNRRSRKVFLLGAWRTED